MPEYKSTYKSEWEEESDVSGDKIKKWVRWITDVLAWCDLCNKEVKVGSLGLSALKRHAGQKKHKENVEASRSNSSNASIVATSTSASVSASASDSTLASEKLNSSSISQTSSTSDLLTETRSEDSLTLTEKISNAEVMWSAMIAEHDLAFLTSDHFF